ncbi:MAG: class I SAM-dependent methyltransferase [Proteobacteria bacterium]|nr:class I SAM-dependent methyltransferase [Pseudomonadota bacterium]
MGFYQNRIFPFLCTQVSKPYDNERRTIFSKASGRVLEIGFGLGDGFKFYGNSVSEIVGLEYVESMIKKARNHVERLRATTSLAEKITLKQGSVTSMNFPDKSFDAVISFLVFCSVPDPETAAKEIHRVLKPNGKLLFFEHVHAWEDGLAKWQTRLNPLWNKVACGCNLTRNTRSILERTGFYFADIKEYIHPKSLKLTSSKIMGTAVKNRY